MVLNLAQPIDRNSRTIIQPPALKQAMENNSSKQPIYVGYAAPGTAQSDEGWMITKITYSGGVPTKIEFADGTNQFSKVWDDRATYSYSS